MMFDELAYILATLLYRGKRRDRTERVGIVFGQSKFVRVEQYCDRHCCSFRCGTMIQELV